MTALAALRQPHPVGEPTVLRDVVTGIEAEMVKGERITGERITELPLQHYFVPGVYAREIFLPKGTLATGRIHKYPQINIVSQGDLSVLTENGWVRHKAPYTVVSPAGTKRLVYAWEDTVFTTIVRTDETDIAKLEDHLTAGSEQDYAAFLASPMKEIT